MQAVGSSQNLTLIVSERTEGQYYCHSITEGYSLLTSQPADILLRRRPRITSQDIQQGQPGEMVKVFCSAVSAPEPTGVSWTFLGRSIQTGRMRRSDGPLSSGIPFRKLQVRACDQHGGIHLREHSHHSGGHHRGLRLLRLCDHQCAG